MNTNSERQTWTECFHTCSRSTKELSGLIEEIIGKNRYLLSKFFFSQSFQLMYSSTFFRFRLNSIITVYDPVLIFPLFGHFLREIPWSEPQNDLSTQKKKKKIWRSIYLSSLKNYWIPLIYRCWKQIDWNVDLIRSLFIHSFIYLSIFINSTFISDFRLRRNNWFCRMVSMVQFRWNDHSKESDLGWCNSNCCCFLSPRSDSLNIVFFFFFCR